VDHHRLTDALTADAPIPHLDSHPPALIDRPWPIWRLVLSLTWPVLLQQLLIFCVSFSDRILAGRFLKLSQAELIATQAALTTATYLAWFISSYTILVSIGSTTLVAHLIGAGQRRLAVHVTNQALVLAALVGLLGSVVGLLILPSLMGWLQMHGPAAAFASDFLRPLFWLLAFQVVESAGVACLAGAGDTRTGLLVVGTVAVLNVPLAWLFFHGLGPLPGLGFPGIALGTAISHVAGAILVLIVLAHGRHGLRLHLPLLWPRLDLMHRLLRISVPAAADSLSVAVGQLVFVGVVNGLGDTASGAHGIALQWEALAYQSGTSFGAAAITLVGQNLGAGRPAQAARCGWVAFGLACLAMNIMGAIFFTLAPQMFQLFCPAPEQQPIVAAGVPVLRLVAFAMVPLASCIIFTHALRGAGDTRVPVLFTWLGFFVIRIPLACVLTRDRIDLGEWGTWPGWNWGLLGAWLAMFADLVVRGLFFLIRFARGRWQRMRV